MIIKYYNLKILLTIDLNKLIEMIIHEYGDSIQLELQVMTKSEKEQVSTMESGILRIIERFWIIENDQRRKDLEESIIDEGRK